MPDRSTTILGLVGLLVVIALVAGLAVSSSDSENPSTDSPVSTAADSFATPFATTTASGEQARLLLEEEATPMVSTVAVLGGSCGDNCVWSKSCVDGQYTMAEQNGMTKVMSNSCIPLEPNSWFIRPENPFAGMPCSRETYGSCMWSRLCVTQFGVVPEKNGLARVVPNSCTVVP